MRGQRVPFFSSKGSISKSLPICRIARTGQSDKAIPHHEGPVNDVDTLPDDKRPSLERQLMREEMSSCIHDYINTLPENYRTIVTLSDIEGLTNQ
jgi:DNA-directed RNA polymerase specialized sigma24 family protein